MLAEVLGEVALICISLMLGEVARVSMSLTLGDHARIALVGDDVKLCSSLVLRDDSISASQSLEFYKV